MDNKQCTDCRSDIEGEHYECDTCDEKPLCRKCMGEHKFFHDSGFEMLK